MYAVLKTGGKQYRVEAGDVLQFEKLNGEVGQAVQFSEVLFFSNGDEKKAEVWLGKPFVENANIDGEIIAQGRGKKLIIQKFKRRKQYRRKAGHRQDYTEVLITALDNGAGGKISLPSTDKKTKIAKFHSSLTPKGGKIKVTPKAETGAKEKSNQETPAKKKTVSKTIKD